MAAMKLTAIDDDEAISLRKMLRKTYLIWNTS